MRTCQTVLTAASIMMSVLMLFIYSIFESKVGEEESGKLATDENYLTLDANHDFTYLPLWTLMADLYGISFSMLLC